MWLKEIWLENIRAFEKTPVLSLSRGINVFVGENNSGKSTLIRTPLLLNGDELPPTLKRHQETRSTVRFKLGDVIEFFPQLAEPNIQEFFVDYIQEPGQARQKRNAYRLTSDGSRPGVGFNPLSTREPNAFIYPYLSSRKVLQFEEAVNSNVTLEVRPNLSNLYAKIDRLSNPASPSHSYFREACESILGYVISTHASTNGKQAGLLVNEFKSIPLTAMGDGVANLLGLIANLAVAENRLFLIEELENDLHPKAIKALVSLIEEKSETNQFLISTHSNVVLQALSKSNPEIFEVKLERSSLPPNSKVERLENSPESRQALLEDLGYFLGDMSVYEGWIFFEEASAERLVRDFFIPWFSKRLRGRIRTYSAAGVDEVEAKFENFNKLFVFIHLQPLYRNKA
ncbi:MAG: AAA family ATPase, partial [Gammaproteobacteria bacterium]|nr:AAA family ATPase [Gammaproteobacteria bacterium]